MDGASSPTISRGRQDTDSAASGPAERFVSWYSSQDAIEAAADGGPTSSCSSNSHHFSSRSRSETFSSALRYYRPQTASRRAACAVLRSATGHFVQRQFGIHTIAVNGKARAFLGKCLSCAQTHLAAQRSPIKSSASPWSWIVNCEWIDCFAVLPLSTCRSVKGAAPDAAIHVGIAKHSRGWII
jgi:hypothetical protein